MISLILATYNRYEELSIFLDSVLHSTVVFEIIIIDQNELINLDSIVSEYRNIGLDIVHIREEEKNLSKARNIGIANAKYEIIGFPDDDCTYEKSTLNRVSDFFSSKKIDILIARWVENSYNYSNLSQIINKKDILNFRTCPLSSITIFSSKSTLEHLNGFDQRLGVGQWFGAGEEIDLIVRAAMDNFNIYFFPQILVHHKFVNNIIGNRIEKNKYLYRARGTGAIYAKNNFRFVIIIRGLLSPMFKCFSSFNYKSIINNMFVFWGRLTGFIVWNIKMKQ
jgi:glycosyltransferase involved in cell wall biosynthesis